MTLEDDPLSDQRLAAELRRRAGDRAPAGLTGAIIERVEGTVQVRTRVWSLGWTRQLAAAVAVIAVGIGALVWLTFARGFVSQVGGPSASPTPTGPMANARAYAAAELADVLSPSWVGRFVVAQGVLRPRPTLGCPLPSSGGTNPDCRRFSLDGLSDFTISAGSDSAATVFQGDAANGTWVFRVTSGSSLALYGEVEPASDGLAWSEGDAAALGFNGVRAPFLVVDGWLVGGLPLPCPSVPGPEGPVQTGGGSSLSWGCGAQAWLTAQPVSLVHRYGGGFMIEGPTGSMQVQTGAYTEFAANDLAANADPVPVPGTWLLRDRRCSDTSSCPTPGGWELVARLDDGSFVKATNPGASPTSLPAATPDQTPIASQLTSAKPGLDTPPPTEPSDADRAFLFTQKFEDGMATGHADTAWTFLAPGEQGFLGSVRKLRAMYAALEPNGSKRYTVHQPTPDALQAGISMDPTGTIRATADPTRAQLVMVDHPDAGGTSAGQSWLVVAPLAGTNDWRIWIVR